MIGTVTPGSEGAARKDLHPQSPRHAAHPVLLASDVSRARAAALGIKACFRDTNPHLGGEDRKAGNVRDPNAPRQTTPSFLDALAALRRVPSAECPPNYHHVRINPRPHHN